MQISGIRLHHLTFNEIWCLTVSLQEAKVHSLKLTLKQIKFVQRMYHDKTSILYYDLNSIVSMWHFNCPFTSPKSTIPNNLTSMLIEIGLSFILTLSNMLLIVCIISRVSQVVFYLWLNPYTRLKKASMYCFWW